MSNVYPLPGEIVVPHLGFVGKRTVLGPGYDTPRLPRQRSQPMIGTQVIMAGVKGISAERLFAHPFVFQISPTTAWTRSAAFSFEDYDTPAGQRSRAGVDQLEQYAFSSMFLDYHQPWMYQSDDDPLTSVQRLLAIGKARKPFRLTIGQQKLWGRSDVVTLATLRSLSVSEQTGEPDARYFDVSFTEWVAAAASRAPRVGQPGAGRSGVSPGNDGGHPAKGTSDSSSLPATLTLSDLHRPTNTLTELARRYYSSPSKWRVILAANTWLRANPDDEIGPSRYPGRTAMTIPVLAAGTVVDTPGGRA